MSDSLDEIEALLPWYAAGALSPAERARVEEALANQPQLRVSLSTIEEDRAEIVELNEAVGAPRRQVWTRVLEGVQATPRPNFLRRTADWLGFGASARPERLALAAIAVAAAIVLEAGAILTLLPSAGRHRNFETVSVTPSPARGADVLVVFSPEAKLEEMTAFLSAQRATIVAGPKPGAMYELRVGDRPLDKGELDALLKTFAASPLVKMALPGATR